MRILCACEESQAVTSELRRLGHEAYSCDLLPCGGGSSRVAHPGGRLGGGEDGLGHGPRVPAMH